MPANRISHGNDRYESNKKNVYLVATGIRFVLCSGS
jgi:hypothetical protein